MDRVTDYSRQGGDVAALAAGIAGGQDGFIREIEHQEKVAGQQLAASTLLPVETRDREAILALGVELGEPQADDPLFCEAKLPAGWTKKASSHSMWSYVYDADGFKRIGLFYKGAFYDRRAEMNIVGVPTTDAQDDALDRIRRELDEAPSVGPWLSCDRARDGFNLVATCRGRYGDDRVPETPPRSRRLHAYSDDGRRVEVVIGPDGTEVSRREFEAEPDLNRL